MRLRPISFLFSLLGNVVRVPLRRRSWNVAALWLKSIRTLFVEFASIAGIVVLALFVWRETTREVIQIDPIGVPTDLASKGYTGEVLSQRIMDHVVKVHLRAATPMARREFGLAQNQLDIVVPGVDFSISTITTYLAELIGTERKRVKGELVERNGLLYLHLRMDGFGTISNADGVPIEELDKTLWTSAEEVVRISEPYVLASYFYEVDPKQALDEIERIIKTEPYASEAQVRAYTLRGLISFDENNIEAAIVDYQKAIELDPDFGIAHGNLGSAFLRVDRFDEAADCFRRAIASEPEDAWGHNGLAMALNLKGKTDEALSALQEAREIDPDFGPTYANLGITFFDKGQFDEAVANFRKAISLGATAAYVFEGLATALVQLNKVDEAIANYHKAIETDNKYARAYFNLGLAFEKSGDDQRTAGKNDAADAAFKAACENFRTGAQLRERQQMFVAAFARVNSKLPSANKCAPLQLAEDVPDSSPKVTK